jgi:hypothetical protein
MVGQRKEDLALFMSEEKYSLLTGNNSDIHASNCDNKGTNLEVHSNSISENASVISN